MEDLMNGFDMKMTLQTLRIDAGEDLMLIYISQF